MECTSRTFAGIATMNPNANPRINPSASLARHFAQRSGKRRRSDHRPESEISCIAVDKDRFTDPGESNPGGGCSVCHFNTLLSGFSNLWQVN